ncbi:MAG: hypothetical protein ACLF0G_12160 [Candidatus Brocadiia bacterium]
MASQDGSRWAFEGRRETFDRDALKKMARNDYPGQLVAIADRFSGAEVSEPREFGSARSKLILVLRDDPLHREKVHLGRQEWIDLVTWVDLNAPYFDTYTDKDTWRRKRTVRLVRVLLPDPWERSPHGEWVWQDDDLVVLKP